MAPGCVGLAPPSLLASVREPFCRGSRYRPVGSIRARADSPLRRQVTAGAPGALRAHLDSEQEHGRGNAPGRSDHQRTCQRAREQGSYQGQARDNGGRHDRAVPRSVGRPGRCNRARPEVRAAGESACRPGSVHPLARAGGHPSGTAVAGSLVRSTREHRAGRPLALAQEPRPEPRLPLDLAPGGVYQAAAVARGAGGLLHHRFTLTPGRVRGRSVLCGTFPRVAPGRRYRPPCPAEPGPSSARPVSGTGRGRPADSPAAGSSLWRASRPWRRSRSAGG